MASSNWILKIHHCVGYYAQGTTETTMILIGRKILNIINKHANVYN